MSQLYAYYVQTEFADERFRWQSGVYNPITLVVAESEEQAIQNLKDFLQPYEVYVGVPYTKNNEGQRIKIANIADFGHGYEIREYLRDPKLRQKYRELLDAYKDHYKRYDLQIFDERGEILWQNDYTQDRNFPTPPPPPKNTMVVIPTEDADRLKAGVGLVGEETDTSARSYVLTSEYTTDENGITTIKQSKFMPDGSIYVRTKVGDNPFTEWSLDPVFTEEAPKDGKQYVRRNNVWTPLLYDDEPKDDSSNLVDSGHLKTYIEKTISTLYRYCGTVDTLQDLPTSGMKIGDTYNIKNKSTLTMEVGGETITISVNAGDNVSWKGTYWDPLAGFIDLDAIYAYVDEAIEHVKDPSIGAGYQTIIDNKLETDAKVISSAINEVNSKTTNVVANLKAGWNTVSTGKLFPVGWVFISKPCCYTEDGIMVDYRIRNYTDNLVNNKHAFDIYVSTDCVMNACVSPWGKIPAVYADYMLVSYYYTGVDGRDLDTVTDISVNGTVIGKTGYGTSSNYIKDPNGNILAVWSGDNTGGNTTASDKYYEQVLIDINAVRKFTANPLEVAFYAAWWGMKLNGYVNSEFITYTGKVDMTTIKADTSTRKFDLSSLTETYHNPAEMRSYVASRATSGSAAKYLEAYTPTVKVKIEDEDITLSGSTTAVDPSQVKKTFSVTQLS